VILLVAGALTGCTDSSSGGSQGALDDGGIPIAALRPRTTAVEKSYYGQILHWKPCSSNLTCATVREPLDWLGVTTKSIRIALVKHAATGTREGDLVVNPGGPGGSGVDFVEAGVENVVDPTIAQHFDIIGFDPRGVGKSAPVKCLSNSDMDKYLYGKLPGAIGSSRWVNADLERSDKFDIACEDHSGPVLARMDSVEAATDMDVIRSALGDRKLNFLGYSYGTFLGTLYAGLFPHNVGKMVLDGADDPWATGGGGGSDGVDDGGIISAANDSNVAQTVGFEDDLTSYLRACVAGAPSAVGTGRCSFDSTLASATTSIEKMLASVNAHPITASDGRRLDAATLATAIIESLYDPLDWPELTKMFAQVQSGGADIAFEFADEYNNRSPSGTYHDNLDLAHLAIGCLENGANTDIDFDERELKVLKKDAPVLGPYDAFSDVECDDWPYGPSAFPNPITAAGTGPILVLGTTGDPATPYVDAQALARQLSEGHLVTYDAQGHTAYDRGDQCIDETVDDYLLKGTVPLSDPQCH
jgi:pimeloyl-ACP methyl ester carboxylesterase